MRTKILFGALLLSVALCSRGFSGDCCAPCRTCMLREPACCEKACGCDKGCCERPCRDLFHGLKDLFACKHCCACEACGPTRACCAPEPACCKPACAPRPRRAANQRAVLRPRPAASLRAAPGPGGCAKPACCEKACGCGEAGCGCEKHCCHLIRRCGCGGGCGTGCCPGVLREACLLRPGSGLLCQARLL